MTNLSTLGNLFFPVQPRFKEGGKDIRYRELRPASMLSGYICCYWQLQTLKTLPAPFIYTAVADGCIDFFFDLNSDHENFLMGLSSECTPFVLNTHFNYLGARFFPGAFPAIYGVNASEFSNQSDYIQNVIPAHYSRIIEKLNRVTDLEKFKLAFDNYFQELVFSKRIKADPRVLEALNKMFITTGSSNVESLTSSVSSRHLRRLFEFYIGAGPKEFARILRFQKFLSDNQSRFSLKSEKQFYDLGYYDQSHFIKEFKTFYGVSPLSAYQD